MERHKRSWIAVKHSSVPNIHMLTHKGATVTNPLDIDNIFNNNFSSITEKPTLNFRINHFKIFFIILMTSHYL